MVAGGALIPPAKRGGNKRTVDVREVVNGLMYILGTGQGFGECPMALVGRRIGKAVWW